MKKVEKKRNITWAIITATKSAYMQIRVEDEVVSKPAPSTTALKASSGAVFKTETGDKCGEEEDSSEDIDLRR